MTDRFVETASDLDRAGDGDVSDGGGAGRESAGSARRIADLERDLEVLRSRLRLSEQAGAVQLARCEQQRVLATELAHRLRNSLALVQAMVSQTLREPVSATAARESLTARIVALGQAHALLIEKRNTGAGVGQIVETALAPHTDGDAGRLRLSGPAARLGSGQALALAMALHELATNAVKYGALSVERGRVEVAWRTSRDRGRRRLTLCWSEHDGPRVAPPTRRGFGSRLIERNLAHALGGEVELRPEPTGMVCRMSALMQPVR